MKIKGICVALAALSMVSLVGCSNEDERRASSTFFFVMNTSATLMIQNEVIDKNVDGYNRLVKETYDLLTSIDSSLSATNPSSCVSLFNAASAGERVEVDGIFYSVLTIAKDMHTLTSGYYNPAVYYSVIDYGFNGGIIPTTTENFPTADTCEKYVTLAESFPDIVLEEESGKYYATKPEATVVVGGETLSLKIDLGGIGKGYATDEVVKLFAKHGFEYGYFSFGSSSLMLKKYLPSSVSYNLGLTDPRPLIVDALIKETYLTVRVQDTTVSTSGDNENYYFIDGKRYSHIIDPTTARPIDNGMMTATIISGSAAENDALTTAIMAMGKERAATFMSTLTDRQVVFAFEDEGYKYVTNMAEGSYQLIDSSYIKAEDVS